MKQRSLEEAQLIQNKLSQTVSGIYGILKYWVEFKGRGQHPTHASFYKNEKEKLLQEVSKAIEIFTEVPTYNIIVVDQETQNEIKKTEEAQREWREAENIWKV